jgi:hypothetical protein
LALSATVKYVAPSSFGTTNTFRPVFNDAELDPLDELLLDEPPLDAALDDELLDPPHAAIPTTVATTASAVTTPATRRERHFDERDPSLTTCMEQPLLS